MRLFQILKTSKNVKLRGLDELRMKFCFLRQSWAKGWRQIDEIKQNSFSMECFTADILRLFYQKMSKFGFWLDGCALAIKSKHSMDFWKFPNFLRS